MSSYSRAENTDVRDLRKFDDVAKTMIDTLREFKHYEDAEFASEAIYILRRDNERN